MFIMVHLLFYYYLQSELSYYHRLLPKRPQIFCFGFRSNSEELPSYCVLIKIGIETRFEWQTYPINTEGEFIAEVCQEQPII